MKNLTVKLNSASSKETFYAMNNFGSLVLTSSKKEAEKQENPPVFAKIEVYSDSVFPTQEEMDEHYRNCAINALINNKMIDKHENVI